MTRSGQPPRSGQYPADPLAFETLLSELSSGFINLEPGKVDEEIHHAQRRVCEELDIDLSVLWQDSTPDGRMILTHFFTRRHMGVMLSPGMSGLQYFPWHYAEMLAGRSVALRSPDELPPAAAVDRESQRLFGVKSALTVPLAVGGGTPFGALGFATMRTERDWPDALVTRLQLVAQVFANALARKRSDEALRQSEARLALAADSAEAGLWIQDLASGVFWATERTRAIFGFSPHDTITMDRVRPRVHRDDWEHVQAALEASAHDPALNQAEYRIVTPAGEVRWVFSRARPHFDASGAPDQVMGVTIDVTERRRAQEALRASRARLEAAAELAGLGFYEADFADRRVFIDERFRQLCGMPPHLQEGLEPHAFWMAHIHPEDALRVSELRRAHEEGKFERISVEYRYLHPVLGERWFQHVSRAAARDAAGQLLVTDGVIRDITEERQIKQDLRDLSRRLIRAHEDERAVLARELHDDISQRLAVLAIDVGRAEIGAGNGPEAETLRGMREGLTRLSEDVHALAYQLHPSILEELGLAEALRAECERRRRQTLLDISVEIDVPPTGVADDAALCLFRVAQEALTNVTRHARAGAAAVRLRQSEGGVLLAVSDDGVGFDSGSHGAGARLGLAGMRERVRLVNGTLTIHSAPGAGTTVMAWVPTATDGGEAR